MVALNALEKSFRCPCITGSFSKEVPARMSLKTAAGSTVPPSEAAIW